MNDLMSGGLHRVWKEQLLARLTPVSGMHVLDVAGGTGDVAFRCHEAMLRSRSIARGLGGSASGGDERGAGEIVVFDINRSMLLEGQRRAGELGLTFKALEGERHEGRSRRGVPLRFVEGDAQRLPFEDNSFDAYTIAFGIRNVTQIDLALAEAHRVLRPGGRFLCLEFSHVSVPGLSYLYQPYLHQLVPAMGQLVAGDRDSYQYLAESIENFPPQRDFAELIEAQGFKKVTYEDLTGGIVAIHSGFKL